MQITMGRENQKENGKGKRTGKVEMRRMENPIRRQITFSKRKAGLLKKTAELSLLCDVDLALIISSPSGRIYHSLAPNIDRTLERYQKFCASSNYSAQAAESIEFIHLDLENARKLKTNLEITQKHMIGKDLDSMSYKELHQLEQKLEIGSRKIRSRKEKLFEEYIQLLRKKSKTRQLGGDPNDGEEGPINVREDLIAHYKQPDRYDGDSDHVASSQTNLDLSL